MNDLLLDTHIWLWYAEGVPDFLAPDVVARIEEARKQRRAHVSVVSVWEIGLLLTKSRIVLSAPLQEWVKAGTALPGLSVRTLTTEVAIESTVLPGVPHADPADRFLIAEARVSGLTLVTADRKIIDYGRVGHVRVLGV
ncbi:MAG: type II toxin-antitoxin system VapC family toxin [Pseudomonadota bacterium]|jgi:PIN domain nuclease of toxin-antitoxin system